jgi:starch-binding outer membrane protein, SusD/RagB family
MNKLYRNISIVMLAMLLSCSEDFITKSDPDQVTDDIVLKDITQVQAAVNGIYDGLQTANYYGRYYVLIPDLMGDGVRQNPDNSNRGTAQYRYEVTTNSGVAQGIWEDAYNVINRANVIIAAIPALEGNEALKNQLLGEALASRALAHFDLVRFFALPYNITTGVTNANGEGGHAGIPVVTSPLTPDAQLSRNTVSEVYTSVVDDLVQAKGLMNDDEFFSQYHFTSLGASALLARVYLYQEEWAKAEAEATNVINSGRYELLSAAEYANAFDGNEANSEAIFDLKFSTADYLTTNQLGYMYSPSGYYDMLPTTDLDDVLADISDPEVDVRASMWDTSVPVALKYLGPENSAGVDNTHILRLSEIYLIRAEARARNSNPTGAREDLNSLRANRGAENSEATDPGLLSAILKERRVELAFEGHRLFDITRNGENLVRNDCSLPNGNCVVNFPDFRFAHPIPQAEIDVNSSISQNEGYN